MNKFKTLILNLIIPLAVGGISSLLSRNQFTDYQSLNQPALAPPANLFPIVWIILYILMGIATYLISTAPSTDGQRPKEGTYSCTKKQAYQYYGIQLFFNFLWSPIFFGLHDYFAALIVLALLWYFVYQTMLCYYSINKTAGLLLLPYLLWITFAGYLNFSILLLNR
ncbi:MAG: tryptophan-rich sensory protein [Lachnospira sp.]|nr:tryptophan-rich sensory protein [Lachnospira sp.]